MKCNISCVLYIIVYQRGEYVKIIFDYFIFSMSLYQYVTYSNIDLLQIRFSPYAYCIHEFESECVQS